MTIEDMTVEEFRDYAKSIRDCWEGHIPHLSDDILAEVVSVEEASYDESYAGDTEGKILVRMSNGEWGAFTEWSDSSGHG